MSLIKLVGLAFVIAAAGCATQQPGTGGGGGGGGGRGSGSGGGGGGGALQPALGTWVYSEVTIVTNSCNSNINHGEAGNFIIDVSLPTSFHVIPGDSGGPFTCTLVANGEFDCPDRLSYTEDFHPTLDAILTVRVNADGLLSDSRHGTGSQVANVTCAGTGCSTIGSLPCTFSQNFAISAL